MNTRIKYGFFILAFVAMIVGYGCSTRKNKLPNRVYHRITGFYNAYFNGYEAFKDGRKQVESAHADNYKLILPVFKFGDETAAQAASPQFDRAIEKSSKVINKHSMYFRNMEYNRVIDGAYLLIGKANFYKREYLLAGQTFTFITSRFPGQTVRNDALMWLAKVSIIQGNYSRAESSLDVVRSREGREKLSKEVRKSLNMVYAELYIKQKMYNKAIEHLHLAIEAKPPKRVRTRLTYILAQVYQENGNLEEAARWYRRVMRMNPPYEMLFHSQLNMARCLNAAGARGYDIEKLLAKMLRDSKNTEYLDEIYYAMAEHALKRNRRAQAKEYLSLSVSKSVANDLQKALSSLKLAELTFEDREYKTAQAYFDTTIAFLSKDYPDYKKIAEKQEILSNLVDNLLIIETQDSLQKLAGMTDAQRNAVIDKIISDIIKKEQQEMREEAERIQSLSMLQQDRQQTSVTQTGQWYFYNPSSLSFGFTEFTKQWGRRTLEDNWRLSNKESVAFGFEDQMQDFSDYEGEEEDYEDYEDDDADGEGRPRERKREQKSDNPKDRNTYLQNIPLTAEKMEKSNQKLSKAIYNAGDIYKNQLSENYTAIEYFERFEKDFGKHELLAANYFQLFRVFTDLNNRNKAEHYKNLLAQHFPDTDYSKLAQDPNYFKDLQSEKDIAEKLYGEAYTDYIRGNYSAVTAKVKQARKQFKNKEVLGRFAYINALTVGKTGSKEDFTAELEDVKKKYPDTEFAKAAQNILDYMSGTGIYAATAAGAEGQTEASAEEEAGPNYIFEPSTIHLCVVVVSVKHVTVNDLRIAFSEHNSEYFGTERLTVSSIYIDNTRQIVTISNFRSMERGMSYLNSFRINGELVDKLEKGLTKRFIMSVNNYSTFVRLKDVEEYEAFFNEHYKTR